MLMSLFEECAVGAVGWMNVLVADGSLVHTYEFVIKILGSFSSLVPSRIGLLNQLEV